MKRYSQILFFVLLICRLSAQEQNVSISPSVNFDTAFIQSYYDKLIAGVYIPHKFVKFGINSVAEGALLEYEPNGRSAIGLEGSYKWLSIGFSVKLPLADKSISQYGQTESFDLQFHLNLRKLIIDCYFQIYNGFYISNMDDYYDSWNYENQYPKTDLTIFNIGVLANYVYNNKKFSYKAALNLTDRQKKNAGSLIMGSYFFINGMSADSTIIPSFATQYFQEMIGLKSLGTLNLGLSCGYAYTFVIRDRFYVNLGIIPGFGLYGINALDNNANPIDFDVNSAIIVQSRISIIYQKDRFYAAMTGVYGTQTSLGKSDYTVAFGHGNTKISLGYRFDFPKRIFK